MVEFSKWPRLLKVAAVHGYGWMNRVKRYSGEYADFRNFLESSKAWDAGQIDAWQREQLCRLLNDARQNTRFYRGRINVEKDDGREMSAHEILAQIPITHKSCIKKNPIAFRNRKHRLALRTSTSGTTGAPMSVEHEWGSIQRRMAILAHHLDGFGASAFDRSVRLSGRVLFSSGVQQKKPWLYNSAERQLFLSTYHLDSRHQKRIADKIRRFDPRVIDGYPSAILRLLEMLAAENISLKNLRVIVSTAETLAPDIRERIEKISGVQVADYYSASEGLPFIQQCRYGTYHLNWQSGMLEVLSDKVASEGDGELICTSFVQRRMPLIRYCTGDSVIGLQRAGRVVCPCGRVTPTVQSIGGRLEDLVYTQDGRTFGMFTYRTLKTVSGLIQFCVTQEDFDRFFVQCVYEIGAYRHVVDAQIKANFEKVLGYPISLDTEAVKDIPLGPNGKVRLVTSKLKGKSEGAHI